MLSAEVGRKAWKVCMLSKEKRSSFHSVGDLNHKDSKITHL